MTDDYESSDAVQNETASDSLEDRVARLELMIEALVKELHRHISLRLPDLDADKGE